MNLDEALEQTRTHGAGPRSNLEKILEQCDEETRQQILAALNAKVIDKSHWARALTKLGQANGWIDRGVSHESILKWRQAHGSE